MFQGMPRQEREKKAAFMLKRVGLANRMMHYPRQMSGGQQQRVGLARAFVSRPEVIVADEPTGNLDSKSTQEVMKMLAEFARRNNQTIILVSHDPDTAAYADHIITLLDGRIVKEEYRNREQNPSAEKSLEKQPA